MSRGRLVSSAIVALAAMGVATDGPDVHRGWTSYGGDPGQRRYSSLAQITPANVATLEVAWTYDSGETGGLQTNPIVVDGTLFTTTPRHNVVALDAATGAERWRFSTGLEGRGPNRGVTYWAGGENDPARIFAAQGPFVYALDARTGQPLTAFGADGRIDLRDGLGREADTQSVSLTTPGVIYRDLLIVGGRVSEGLPASPGDIRAFDVRSGARRWSFHTIPHPGEIGHDTWPAEGWRYIGGANNWAGMALDVERGIVFVPTGSAAADFYGANRLGDNLFANTLLALDALTGKRIWHFQSVRHDIWDRDFPSPPTLVTVRRGGDTIDAVAQTTKHGWVLVFDRASGRSLFPIEDRRFPESPVDGEHAAATQPMPLAPAPFARQRLTESMLTTRTPAAHEAAVAAFRTFRSDGQFVPLAVGQPTVVFPGFDGGAEWGGSAFDPATRILYVNANEMAWTGELAVNERPRSSREVYLRECASCHRDDLSGAPPQIPGLMDVGQRRSRDAMTAVIRQGAGRMPAFPNLAAERVSAVVEWLQTGIDQPLKDARPSPIDLKYRFTGYRKFLDPDGYPAITPPWGTLNAIDLGSGRYVWTVPLGEYPELAAAGLKNTGSENYGGPIVTAGGLVFIGATSFDRKFRAFDKATGALLWETLLPFSGTGTPSTYEVRGRQFVVVPAGGGKSRPQPGRIDQPPLAESGGIYVAFALPERR